MMNNIKVGDTVRWMDSPYTVEKVVGNKVLLKQNFSIGTTLNTMINIEEVKKINK